MSRIMLALLMLAVAPQSPSDFAKSITANLPVWKADRLALFEQPEIALVQRDLDEGVSDDKLRMDWGALVALDNFLAVSYAI